MTVVYKPMHAVQIAVRIATVQLTNLIYIYEVRLAIYVQVFVGGIFGLNF
mgnify:CR=1 FL=1